MHTTTTLKHKWTDYFDADRELWKLAYT